MGNCSGKKADANEPVAADSHKQHSVAPAGGFERKLWAAVEGHDAHAVNLLLAEPRASANIFKVREDARLLLAQSLTASPPPLPRTPR